MTKYLKDYFYYICVATTINVISHFVKSDFITTFPGADFLTIMLTLLAINIATSSYIVSKLEEMTSSTSFTFTKTYASIKGAIKEQIVLVVIAFILLIGRSSEYLTNENDYEGKYALVAMGINLLLTTVFIAVISILWNTGKSIFTLVKKKNN